MITIAIIIFLTEGIEVSCLQETYPTNPSDVCTYPIIIFNECFAFNNIYPKETTFYTNIKI